MNVRQEEEEVYNLGAASVADLSTWLQEVTVGDKSLNDYKADGKNRAQRDMGRYETPR